MSYLVRQVETVEVVGEDLYLVDEGPETDRLLPDGSLVPLPLSVTEEGPEAAGQTVVGQGYQKFLSELETAGKLIVHLHHAVKEEKKDRCLALVSGPSRRVSGPEWMSAQDPLPLNEGLEAVQGPGVGVQDDLGQAGDDEAEVGAGVVGEEDGGLLPLETLSRQAGRVENISHVSQPATSAQPGEPLGQRERRLKQLETNYSPTDLFNKLVLLLRRDRISSLYIVS